MLMHDSQVMCMASAASAVQLPSEAQPASEQLAPHSGQETASKGHPAQQNATPQSMGSSMGPAAEILCVVCQQHGLASDGDWEALECGHVFHQQCLNDYCQAIGVDKGVQVCPYKCANSVLVNVPSPDNIVPSETSANEAEEHAPGLSPQEVQSAEEAADRIIA